MTGKLLASQLEYTSFTLRKNLDGITQADSLTQPEVHGNCINWVVGHILYHRNIMHRLSGIAPAWEDETAERYKRGSDPMTSSEEAHDVTTMLQLYEASHSALTSRLEELTEEELAQEAGDDVLAMQLAGLIFHESYHMGQIGIIRRVIGKEPKMI
jgi:uncharacterized damage-inducible protein DinB